MTTGKEMMQKEFLEKLEKEKSDVEDYKKLRQEVMDSKKILMLCQQCSCIFIDNDEKHSNHTTRKISKEELKEPSKFLMPAENKKTNAVSFDINCSF